MNRSSDPILSVYSDARSEYTKQLCVFLVPAYFQFFVDLLAKAKENMVNEPKRALWQFQTYLNEIHDWNMERVNNEIHKIHVNCGCDYLEDLLTAVFIAHTKVLTAIRLSSNNKKVDITIPKVEHFLFKVLCETSKLLWSSTYLFRDGVSGIDKQQNYRSIEGILNEGIFQAVRSLVPVKSILKDFINGDLTTEESSTNATANDTRDSDEDEEDSSIVIPPEVSIQKPVEKPVEIPIEKPAEAVQLSNDIPFTETPKNEIIIPTPVVTSPVVTSIPAVNAVTSPIQLPPQTIIIDDKPNVRFAHFDSMFDSENPDDSDMIYEPKEKEDSTPDLSMLDSAGMPLSEGLDFDSLDAGEPTPLDDYEEL